jgi:hypothetical protein
MQPPAPAQPPAQRAVDPVASLKPLIEHFQASYGRRHDENNGVLVTVDWETLSDLRYDVQRTESLVSPYVAYLTFEYQKHYTVQQILKPENDTGHLFFVGKTLDLTPDYYKVTLAMQDSQWVLTDVHYRTPDPIVGGWLINWSPAYDNQIAEVKSRLGLP